MTVLAYLCLCRVSIAIVRTLPGQQTHHTDLSKTKNVLQRTSLSYSKWNAQLQHFSELNIMCKWARQMHFTNFRTLSPWQPDWPAPLPTAPVPALLLQSHPTWHCSQHTLLFMSLPWDVKSLLPGSRRQEEYREHMGLGQIQIHFLVLKFWAS